MARRCTDEPGGWVEKSDVPLGTAVGAFFSLNEDEKPKNAAERSKIGSVVDGDTVHRHRMVRRPDPPAELTEEQAEEWQAVVNRLPADWFPRKTQQLLVQYCRHVVCARRVAQLIARAEAEDEFDIKYYARLLRMQETEGRAISSLATRMRMTQHATVKHAQARKPSMVKKPWDED
jgi:hypothetical protein